MNTKVADLLEQEVKAHHKNQLVLCDVLEAIADDLPRVVDRQQCLSVARCILPTVKKAHALEEERLFPFLLALPNPPPSLKQSLERLRYEHWEDESYAEEVSESLREFGAGDAPEASETLAYMLRGFFEGLRRHMAFESEYLLPMLKSA